MPEEKSGKEIISESLDNFKKIADALQEFNNNKFSKTMLRLFLKDKTKLPYRDIDKVLDAVNEYVDLANDE